MVGTIIFYVELNVTARSGACPVVVSNFEIDIHQYLTLFSFLRKLLALTKVYEDTY